MRDRGVNAKYLLAFVEKHWTIWEMLTKSTFDWREQTPSELTEAVAHLREQYDDSSWEINTVTQKLCYRALHPQEEVKDLQEYERAFEQMARSLKRDDIVSFLHKKQHGTEPAFFSAHYSVRQTFLRSLLAGTTEELLSIANVQRNLLSAAPPNWVNAQVQNLIDQEIWRTPSWVKSVCDIQSSDPDHDLDEAIDWRRWRAPFFLVMTPSRMQPFEPDRSWERQDEVTTERWLDRFAEDIILSLERVLRGSVGRAHLAELKQTPIPTSEQPRAAIAEDHPRTALLGRSTEVLMEFGHTDDYRSIRHQGKEHSLTARQATVVKLLHEALLSGYPLVAKARLLSAVESETSAVRDIFKGSPLWNTLISPAGGRGFYRLNLR